MKKHHGLERNEVTPYDLFIVAITVLSIVNIGFYLLLRDNPLIYAISLIDVLLSIIFFCDFLRLFFKAKSKARYFFHQFGWADLLASLPFPQLKILRLFRLVKAYGLIRRVGIRNISKEFAAQQASVALFVVLFIIILLLEFGSVGILAAEQGVSGSTITSASDALWWVYVTITTVGYGDTYPVTDVGRIIGAAVMLVGVGLFGVVTGFLANKFLPRTDADTQVKDLAIAQITNELKALRMKLEGNDSEKNKNGAN